MVLEQVDAEHGLVKIDGEMWTARSFDGARCTRRANGCG